jgi:putative hydrolase of the HAD superfamily
MAPAPEEGVTAGAPVPVRGVVFDLDDTLLDHRGSAVRALHRWLPGLGVAPTPAIVDAWFEAEDRHFPRWSAGEITHPEQRRDRLRDFLPATGVTVGNDDRLDREYADYLACYRASWVTFEDVGPTVERLHRAGLVVGVLSNGLAEQQQAKVESTGWAQLLGPLCTPDRTGFAKPDPSAFLAVCQAVELPPAAVLHVGDRHDLDVVAARAAGLQAVHLDRQGRGPVTETARITSLHQLRID